MKRNQSEQLEVSGRSAVPSTALVLPATLADPSVRIEGEQEGEKGSQGKELVVKDEHTLQLQTISEAVEVDFKERMEKLRHFHLGYSSTLKHQVWELLKVFKVREVWQLFKGRIPRGTLREWWRKQDRGLPLEKPRGPMKVPFAELEEKLYAWICTMRTKQLAVRRKDIQNKSLEMAKELKIEDKFKGCNSWVIRFEKRHGLSLRQKTRVAYRTTSEMYNIVSNFFVTLNATIQRGNITDLWNYDEVGIYYEPHIPRTVTHKGERSVSVLSVQAQNMRMSVILMISARGLMAPPVLMFHNKNFEQFELPEYPDALVMSSPRGFNIEDTNYHSVLPHFLRYIKEGSLLLFDECRAHHSDRIYKLIESRNINYLRLPGSSTCLLQPVDSNIGKIVKSEVRERFIQWCTTNVDIITAPEGRRKKSFKKPTNKELGSWIAAGVQKVRSDEIKASFHNTGIVSKNMQKFILEEKIPKFFVNRSPKIEQHEEEPTAIAHDHADQTPEPGPTDSPHLISES